MYIRVGKEVHTIQEFFGMQLLIQMRDFLGHLEVSSSINTKFCYVNEINKS
jgi:hypothetical protein